MDNMNSQGHANLRKVTPDATVFETSTRTGRGVDGWRAGLSAAHRENTASA
jgi:hypothetical protein